MGKKLLPDKQIEMLVRSGKGDTEIVRYLQEHDNISVTRQAIQAWRKRNAQESKHGREIVYSMPWRIRPEHSSLEAARAIRWQARVDAGLPVSPEDLDRLARVKRHLGAVDGVFHYEPDTPQGWFIVSRRPGVDTGIVRNPDVA